MKIYSVFDEEFRGYGHVIDGYDTAELMRVLDEVTPLPDGTDYVASQPELEALPIAAQFSANEYGGMPIQLGWCNGHNTKLNCLEYHRDSEINCGVGDFILLLARLEDIVDGRLDSAKVKAFRAPAGVPVEVYGSTMHYAPCNPKKDQGFKVLIVLPRGTNGPKPEMTPVNDEDKLLWACNKWLLAHPDSGEAAQGAAAVIDGVNVDIAADLD